MTKEEAIEVLAQDLPCETDEDLSEAMTMAIKALEQQPCEDCINRNDKRIIHTDGLEEGIRCAMCTNPMANDRGCDGGCIVNESMYQNVLNVIKKQILEQEPCDDAVSRQEVFEQINCWIGDGEYRYTNATDYLNKRIKALPSVTPKEKTGHWEYVQYDGNPNIGNLHCSECERIAGFEYNYCPNCGARMVSE